MSNSPFFYTWTAQSNAPKFEIKGCNDFSYILSNDQEVFDLASTSFQASFGLKPHFINDIIKKTADNFSVCSPKADYPLKIEATKKLLDFIDNGKGKIFYTVSGAEAVENALKMARAFTKKNLILSRKCSYHGATLGALSITGDWRSEDIHNPKDHVRHIPEPDSKDALELTEKIIRENKDHIAALCLETITGGNGVIMASQKWWDGIKDLCKKYDILLIIDEITCGFYRTGKSFGFKNYNIQPDIVTMAKAITGGTVPFGAVFVSNKIADAFDHEVLKCGLTHYAHPLGIAAMNATLDFLMNKEFTDSYKERENILQSFLESIKDLKGIKDIRKIGMLVAIDLEKPIQFQTLIENGIYTYRNEKGLILAPALNYDLALMQTALDKLKECLNKEVAS